MPRNHWLPSAPPLLTIVVAATIGVVLIVAATLFSLQTPWLGLSFVKPQSHGYLEVATVDPRGPAADLLEPGDRIIAFTRPAGDHLDLSSSVLVDEPNMLASYAALNGFFREHGELWDLLDSLRVGILLDVGSEIVLYPWISRPLDSLPYEFWLINICGLAVLVMGVAVWSFRRGSVAPRLLAIAGFGYFVGAVAASIYVSREIALQPEIFKYLAAANDLGIMLLGYSLVSLLWYYPTRLGHWPAAWYIFPAVFIGWLTALFQVVAISHSFYKYALVYVLLLAFGYRQWRSTADSPIDRAALKWLLLTILITIGLAVVLFYLPILIAGEPVASIAVPFFLVFVLFFGLTLGVTKYRLFNIQRWWLEAWFWLLGGFIVLLVDASLVYFLELNMAPALGLSVVAVGWLYFPLRQWILGYFVAASGRNPEHYLPVLIDSLFSAPPFADPNTQFKSLLRKVFAPSSIREFRGVTKLPEIADNGLLLRLCSLDGTQTIEMASRNHGKRLFAPDDVRLAGILRTMALKAITMRRAQEEGARLERARIMRDLHDDVAAKLLSLAHRSREPAQAEQARSALRALRDTIYSLDDNVTVRFEDLLSDLSAEVREWLPDNVRLEWEEPDARVEQELTPRQQINIRRIVQEALSNAIRHARPATVAIRTELDTREGLCRIAVCNDGEIEPMTQWVAGKGLNNMKTRAEELGGRASWSQSNDGRCCVTIEFPLRAEKE